jgi:hypothetical protein
MTRPLALIEGDLTIPLPRPFDGLPPPFGSRRRVVREAVQQAVREAVDPVPQRARSFPPGVRHVLFYKARPQRVDPHRFDAEMAEAKRYLEMGKVRARSSRSDHALAAGIFAGCTIALTWLLVTCSMKESTNSAAVTPAVAPSQAGIAAGKSVAQPVAVVASAEPATPASADSPNPHRDVQTGPTLRPTPLPTQAAPAPSSTLAQSARSEAKANAPSSTVASKRTGQIVARTDVTVMQGKKAVKPAEIARLSQTRAEDRVALNRATHPASKPAVSQQPEWTARTGAPRNDVATDDASWLNWAAQQHRPAPSMRASVPSDTSWNSRMMQRRITDNPDAFK